MLTARPAFSAVLAELFGRAADPADQALVDRAKAGDPKAFREIFDRFGPAVRRFTQQLLRDAALADEATQDTFVRALDRIGGLRRSDRLMAWLLSIARKVCFEHRRRRLMHQSRHADGHDALAHVPAPFNPEQTALDREAATVMQRALEQLSEDRQTALLLRFDHALPYQELAVVMGWSVAKAKVEVHRARLQLRAKMDAYELGSGGSGGSGGSEDSDR